MNGNDLKPSPGVVAFVALCHKMGKMELGSVLKELACNNPYANKSVKVGKTVVTYTGVDADVIKDAPVNVLLMNSEASISAAWVSPTKFSCIIKAGKSDDEPGRWSRWDIETDMHCVYHRPNTKTARAYWQAMAVIAAVADVQVRNPVDWMERIKSN